MVIYFVRHGQTDWNVLKKIQGKTDIPLNEKGKEQAKETAKIIANRGYDLAKVYSSKHIRALETAKEIAKACDLECVPIDGLEEMNLGDWEGKSWSDIIENEREFFEYWDSHRRYEKTPNGECYQDVFERVYDALIEIIDTERKDVVVVTHSAVIMSMRCLMAGDRFENMPNYNIDNAEILGISKEEILESYKKVYEREE